MNLHLTGKKALVTGGTAGIGYAIAKALASEGVDVWITGRTEQTLTKASEIQKAAGAKAKVVGIVADLSESAGTVATVESLPQVDILVNNLGIYESKDFAKISDEDWINIFTVNVMSGVRTSRAYLPKMLAQDWGRIIFIASESGVNIPPDMIHYGMTKAAQLAISRGLAETTKGTKVTVNTIMPGPTRSAGIVGFMQSLVDDPKAPAGVIEAEFFEKFRPASLLQRLIDPKEIANAVTYLASPLSSATNGAAIRVEGGLIHSMI